jgi:4-amino-4-deoxy-L-arabinose transferase-like glycosyltransferase
MAREMFASGDWITTRLNGIKYFRKAAAADLDERPTFAVFGLGDWQARLWTGLCGLGGVVLTGYAGKRVFGEPRRLLRGAGARLQLLLGGLCSQINSLDMSLSGHDDHVPVRPADRPARRGHASRTAQLDAGVLGRHGAVGAGQRPDRLVLPGGVLVLYTLLARDLAIWRRLHLVKGLLLFFLIATPWFVLVGAEEPGAAALLLHPRALGPLPEDPPPRRPPGTYFFVLLAPAACPGWACCRRAWLDGSQPSRPLQAAPAAAGVGRFILFFFS